jgi:hypothetical protein
MEQLKMPVNASFWQSTLECVRMILCEEEKNNVFSMLDGLSFSIL